MGVAVSRDTRQWVGVVPAINGVAMELQGLPHFAVSSGVGRRGGGVVIQKIPQRHVVQARVVVQFTNESKGLGFDFATGVQVERMGTNALDLSGVGTTGLGGLGLGTGLLRVVPMGLSGDRRQRQTFGRCPTGVAAVDFAQGKQLRRGQGGGVGVVLWGSCRVFFGVGDVEQAGGSGRDGRGGEQDGMGR